MKKFRQGFTLVELTVAMAITTVVLAGATVLFFSFNKSATNARKEGEFLQEVRTLSMAFDKELTAEFDESILVQKSAEKTDPIFIKTSSEINKKYYFDSSTFFYTENDGEETKEIVKLNYEVDVEILSKEESSLYMFKFHYGESKERTLELMKVIYDEE